jgi:hypothetical protein
VVKNGIRSSGQAVECVVWMVMVGRVADGDTLVLLVAGKTQGADRVCRDRLFGVVAGVREEGEGSVALSRRRGRLTVEWEARGRYGHMIGKVVDVEDDVNLSLMRDGMCWCYGSMPASSLRSIRCSMRRSSVRRGERISGCGEIVRSYGAVGVATTTGFGG